MPTHKSVDKETKFLKYMIQRQKNGELSLYGYERKLFQGTEARYAMRSMLNLPLAKYLSDLITFVGEPTTPPDPLDLLSVNLYDQSDFVAVTWSKPI